MGPKDPNKNMLTVANEIIWLLCNKQYDKPLTKDETLTYNACLRFTKAIADKLSDDFYPKQKEFGIKNDWDEDLGDATPAGAPA